jgi:hypothetical protein
MSSSQKKKSKAVGKKTAAAAALSRSDALVTPDSDALSGAAGAPVPLDESHHDSISDGMGASVSNSKKDESAENQAAIASANDPDVHPLRCGHSIVVRYRDNSERLSKVRRLICL